MLRTGGRRSVLAARGARRRARERATDPAKVRAGPVGRARAREKSPVGDPTLYRAPTGLLLSLQGETDLGHETAQRGRGWKPLAPCLGKLTMQDNLAIRRSRTGSRPRAQILGLGGWRRPVRPGVCGSDAKGAPS